MMDIVTKAVTVNALAASMIFVMPVKMGIF
jgi:hypothetical protein